MVRNIRPLRMDDMLMMKSDFYKKENTNTEKYLSRITFRDRSGHDTNELANYTRYSSVIKAGEYIFYFKNDGPRIRIFPLRAKGNGR
ncbi:MAG: hypothetical protein R3A12_10075 [Ignavibacteria bacterium]